jgi:GMP synthase (glutamine-hydrolysing)
VPLVLVEVACRPVYGDPSRNRVTGIRDGKRDCGQQIEVRCWDSIDARAATSTRLPLEILEKVAGEIIRKVPGIVSVTHNIAPKPPSTIEVV